MYSCKLTYYCDGLYVATIDVLSDAQSTAEAVNIADPEHEVVSECQSAAKTADIADPEEEVVFKCQSATKTANIADREHEVVCECQSTDLAVVIADPVNEVVSECQSVANAADNANLEDEVVRECQSVAHVAAVHDDVGSQDQLAVSDGLKAVTTSPVVCFPYIMLFVCFHFLAVLRCTCYLLSCYGIQMSLLLWIKNFLNNRTCETKVACFV